MVWSQEMSESFGAAMERWHDSGAYHSPSELAAHRERDVSDAGHGDSPVQHGDGGGGRQRAVGQPDTQSG